MKIEAPFTPEQVAFLNAWQTDGRVHPFTCGSGDRGDDAHKAYVEQHGGDYGQLVAGQQGWVCPVCTYTQTWAHDFMAGPIPDFVLPPVPKPKGGKGSGLRGFAAMDPEKRREIARKGGGSVPDEKRSFAKNRFLARAAGAKGGAASRGGGRGKRKP